MQLMQPLSVFAAMMAGTGTTAQEAAAPTPPTMNLLYRMACDLGERIAIDSPPYGQMRMAIPIIGGTFKGPNMSGKILNIGADWLLVDAHGTARPDTRYNLQTDDGAYIYVQTNGPRLKDGRILLRGTFETSTNGTYSWLNDVVAVGVLNVNGTNQVLIDMWEAVP
ncbi:hypothetical protein ACEQ8H_004799 [Pleosporales sp. CAS-2024a]